MELIKNYRINRDSKLLEDYKYICDNNESDLNFERRKNLILSLYEVYTKNDKPLIKWLLEEEIKYSRIAWSSTPTTEVCAFMLYKHFAMEDIYQLFDAKFETNYDNRFVLDVELIFGFDRQETKNYLLKEQTEKEKNKEILDTIIQYENDCKDIPNAFKDREKYIEYFETKRFYRLDFEE